LLVLKGASEKVLQYCCKILDHDGTRVFKAEDLAQINEDIAVLSKMGERVLGFCMALLPKEKYKDTKFEGTNDKTCNFPMNGGLTYVGMMSMIDPPRPGVPEAVASCQSAGIRVIMVTGDHPLTAQAIAKKVGIIHPKSQSIILHEQQGEKVEEALNDEAQTAVVVHGTILEREIDVTKDIDGKNKATIFWNKVLAKKYVAFARTSPAQKLLIVNACQERGGIVAVTGDGVNDSPALKKADIGIAMGITGTDVSKDAADMILLDDNFASIVKGVEEGRIIFDNLKKSIAYTLSSNIPEIAPFLLNVVAEMPLPLPTPLILCVDLGTDMAPAISMAYESKESNIMTRKPRDPEKDKLVTGRLVLFAYLQIGLLQALAGFYAYMVVLWGEINVHPYSLIGLDKGNKFIDQDDLLACCSYDKCGYYELGKKADYAQEKCSGIPENDWLVVDLTRHERKEALHAAQTAYFISIIVVQWADLLICKTRYLSIFTHGMKNKFMNKAILFETILGAGLSYLPFAWYIGTRPLRFVYWCAAIPFNFVIFFYDELRKTMIRRNPGGWLERTTYW